MSKRELKTYLTGLSKDQMETQILDLYTRLKEVKVYYDFVFNPNEQVLLDQAKLKIGKEYNVNLRRPKARRSVAQKHIIHFKKLEVSSEVIIDLMLFNIETAQAFNGHKEVKSPLFYSSILNSFRDVIRYIHGVNRGSTYRNRVEQIVDKTYGQRWFNNEAFENEMQKY